MFSIVYGALLRGLPVPASGRLVHVASANPSRDQPALGVFLQDFHDFRERQRSFAGLAAHYNGTVNLERPDREGRSPGALRRPFRLRQPVRRAARPHRPGPGPHLRGRGRRARGHARSADLRWRLAAPLPRRPQGGGQAGTDQRRGRHPHRRPAAGLRLPLEFRGLGAPAARSPAHPPRRGPAPGRHRPAERRRHPRIRPGGPRGDRPRPRRRAPADQPGADRLPPALAQGGPLPRHRQAPVGDAGGLRLRAPDRLRQRGEPHPLPRRQTHAGDRHPHHPRGRPPATGRADPEREPAPRGHGRRARRASGRPRGQAVQPRHRRQQSTVVDEDRRRSRGPPLHPRRHRGRGPPLGPDARPPVVAGRPGRGAQRRGARFLQPAPGAVLPLSRGGRGRLLLPAARGHRPHGAQRRAPEDPGPGLRHLAALHWPRLPLPGRASRRAGPPAFLR